MEKVRKCGLTFSREVHSESTAQRRGRTCPDAWALEFPRVTACQNSGDLRNVDAPTHVGAVPLSRKRSNLLGGTVPGIDRLRPGRLKSPRLAPRAFVVQQCLAYRLAWRLAPPLAPAAWLPKTSPLETSLTHSEPSPL